MESSSSRTSILSALKRMLQIPLHLDVCIHQILDTSKFKQICDILSRTEWYFITNQLATIHAPNWNNQTTKSGGGFVLSSIALSYTSHYKKNVRGLERPSNGYVDAESSSSRQHPHHQNSNSRGPEQRSCPGSIPVRLASLH
jgi:hypothetical protein